MSTQVFLKEFNLNLGNHVHLYYSLVQLFDESDKLKRNLLLNSVTGFLLHCYFIHRCKNFVTDVRDIDYPCFFICIICSALFDPV